MADYSKLSPDNGGTILNCKDATARTGVNNAFKVMGEMGAKNLIPIIAKSQVVNNELTLTVNADKSIRIQGTPSQRTTVTLTDSTFWDNVPYNRDIILSGGNDHVWVQSNIGGWTTISKTGVSPTVQRSSSLTEPKILLLIETESIGVTIDETIYPMLRLADDSDSSYQPYAMTNRELTDEVGLMTKTGNHSINILVTATTTSNGSTPEFFIPWTNPHKKAITFDNFEVRIRSNGSWTTLTQSSAPNIQAVSENGFYVNVNLSTALPTDTTYTLRLTGNIVFS